MKQIWKSKLAIIPLVLATASACSQPAPARPETFTAEDLLNTLVQIAAQEDLSDDKRIGGLLGISFQMVNQIPRTTDDGKTVVYAIANKPLNPGYLAPNGYFNYGVRTAPKRTAALSLSFNNPATCLPVSDVYSAFIRHGSLNQLPPPTRLPPPPGTSYPPVIKDQPVYGYAFNGEKTSGSIYFKYTKCLSEIHFGQPSKN